MKTLYIIILIPFVINFTLSQSTITKRILAVMVDFQEDNDPLTTGNGKFDLKFTSRKIIDPPPHDTKYFSAHLEFLKNYFRKISNGKLNIEYELLDKIFTLPNQMRHYSPPPDSGNERLLKLVYDTWTTVKSSTHRPSLPFNSYDCFIIFHAGVGRDVNLSAFYGYNPQPFDIPSVFIDSLTISEFLNRIGTSISEFEIKNSIILPETESRTIETVLGQSLLQIGLNGILVSNFASYLGLPDLFDTKTGSSRIGRFGLMDGPGIFSYRGVLPPEPSAWEKIKLGFAQPIEVKPLENDTLIFISAFQHDPARSIYKVPITAKEYILIENRNRDVFNDGARLKFFVRDSTGERIVERVFTSDVAGFNYFEIDSLYGTLIDADEFDWAMPGSGILLWYIDERVIEEKIKTNSINNDPKRLGVKLIEADGPQVIFGDEIGWEYDMWFKGNTASIYRNELSTKAYPWNYTNDYSNPNIKIYDFSSPGPVMSFKISTDINSIQLVKSFPRKIENLDDKSFITVGNIDADEETEILINSPSGIYAFNSSGTSSTLDTSGLYSRHGFAFALAIFDVNGDGKNEVIGVEGRKIFVFKTEDTNLDGLADTLWTYENENPISTPPAIFNNLILFGDSAGFLTKLNINGTLNSKVKISTLPIASIIATEKKWFAIANDKVKNENFEWISPEKINFSTGIELLGGNLIVALTSERNLFILDPAMNSFKQISLNDSIKTPPAVADINFDMTPDIILTAGNKIWAFNHLGAVIQNFPIEVKRARYLSAPVIADVSKSGNFKAMIIVGSDANLIFAFDNQGKIIEGFPISISGKVLTSPAIFNEGNYLNLAVPSDDGFLYLWKIKPQGTYVKVLWSSYLGDSKHGNYASQTGSPMPTTSSRIIDDKETYNWPNPATEGYTFIRFKTFADAKINIKIYDVAGLLVDEINTTTTALFENEVKWETKNVQTGIYYARIEANTGSRSDVKIIKIAIVNR